MYTYIQLFPIVTEHFHFVSSGKKGVGSRYLRNLEVKEALFLYLMIASHIHKFSETAMAGFKHFYSSFHHESILTNTSKICLRVLFPFISKSLFFSLSTDYVLGILRHEAVHSGFMTLDGWLVFFCNNYLHHLHACLSFLPQDSFLVQSSVNKQ